jgi:hypothetical protein
VPAITVDFEDIFVPRCLEYSVEGDLIREGVVQYVEQGPKFLHKTFDFISLGLFIYLS